MFKAIYLLVIMVLLAAIVRMVPNSINAEFENVDALVLNHKMNL